MNSTGSAYNNARTISVQCLDIPVPNLCRFLELAQLHANQEDDSALFHYQVQGSYDSELMQLQESFQGKIVHLLSDTV